MPVNPAVAPNAPPPHTVLEIIVDAMIEIEMLQPGDEPEPNIAQWALRKYNYLLNYWAAKKNFVYSTSFQLFNLVAGLSPHTIGPQNATFNVPQRPVKIESWALVLNNGTGTPVDLPHKPLRDNNWWAMQRVKSLQSNIPTDLYYSPDQPNGSLFFWPVPNAVYPVRLELWSLISEALSITDPIDGAGGVGTLPPAYRAAIMLSLAETLQPGAGKEANPQLASMAMTARAAVFGNNNPSPPMETRDSGMPNKGGRGGFNWLTGNLG